MTTIQLDGQLEDRLKRAAEAAGAEPVVVARQVLEEHLPRPNAATVALLKKWNEEEATTDAAELQRQHEQGQTFMENLARNRIESEGPNARKLWP